MGLLDIVEGLVTLPLNITRDVVRTVVDRELPPVDESKTVENLEKLEEELNKISI